jgi:hypothetical protein
MCVVFASHYMALNKLLERGTSALQITPPPLVSVKASVIIHYSSTRKTLMSPTFYFMLMTSFSPPLLIRGGATYTSGGAGEPPHILKLSSVLYGFYDLHPLKNTYCTPVCELCSCLIGHSLLMHQSHTIFLSPYLMLCQIRIELKYSYKMP